MATKRRYTEAEKSEALAAYAACGNNAAEAARLAGVPVGTLKDWIDGQGVTDAVNPAPKKRDMADECERIAWKLLGSLDNAAAIAAAPLGQRSTAFGTIVDKMRLLRGQSTENIDLIENAARETDTKFAAIIARRNAAGVLDGLDTGAEGGAASPLVILGAAGSASA
jgi:transposase-like protein